MARSARRADAVVVRLHEATGVSPKGWDGAILAAIAAAKKEIEGDVVGFEVVRFAGDAGPRSIRAYRATVRVAYWDRVTSPKSTR